MENRDIFFSRLAAGANDQMPQCVHDLCNVDIVWASNTAGIAGSADPDRFGTKNPFAMTILDMPEDLIWKKIHRIYNRTACGALLALVARLKIDATRLNNFRQKGIFFWDHPLVQIHFSPPNPRILSP